MFLAIVHFLSTLPNHAVTTRRTVASEHLLAQAEANRYNGKGHRRQGEVLEGHKNTGRTQKYHNTVLDRYAEESRYLTCRP